VRYLIFIISFFLFKQSYSATEGAFSSPPRIVYNSTSDSSNSVRKSVFKIKGKPVERQVYFEYLKCKLYKRRIVSTSILIGIGAAAIAGSIPLLMRTNGFSGNGIYYSSGGIALANLGVFGLAFGIPFTISNVRFYNKTKCREQSIYISPRLNGLGLAWKF
jgi:hypothetical protein